MHKKSTYDTLRVRNSPEYSCFGHFEPRVLMFRPDALVVLRAKVKLGAQIALLKAKDAPFYTQRPQFILSLLYYHYHASFISSAIFTPSFT